MLNNTENYNQLKDLLNCEDLKVILTFAISHWNLVKLVNKLNLSPKKDIKTAKIPTKNLAGFLAEGAFSDPSIFKEIIDTLDLYSAEAREGIKNSGLEGFKDSVDRENGRRRKTDMARLIWTLVKDTSSEKRVEGKALILELTNKKIQTELDKKDTGDGDKANIKNRQRRDRKRSKEILHKKNFKENGHEKDKNVILRLKNEIEMIKKENTRLLQQIQSSKSNETIKGLETRVAVLEKENRETSENINRDYVPKDKFDALKKEIERLSRIKKSSDKIIKKMDVEKSGISPLRRTLNRFIPFLSYHLFPRRGKNCRVGIFVDVQNMFYSAKNLYHGRLDFEKFLTLALQGRKLIQATAYIVKTPEIDQSKFINLLKSNDYAVKTLDLKTGMNGYAKGNWDVGMVMDIFALADKLDVIALASGDGDFVPLVKYLQTRGIRVEVYGFAYNTAIDLKECADKFYPLKEDILIKDQRGMVKQH